MSNFEEKLKEAFAGLIHRRLGVEVQEVFGIDQETEEVGGCPTCDPDTRTYVEVYYRDGTGKVRWHKFDDNLFDLISELAEYEGWEL